MDVVQQVDGAKRAPRYEVDLDAAPEHRWRIIIQDYLPHILQVDEVRGRQLLGGSVFAFNCCHCFS
jgi:hypothetical protein